MHDPLQDLLRAADGDASGADQNALAATGPKLRALAAQRTRQRRRRARAALGAAVLLAVVGVSRWLVQRDDVPPVGDQQVVADAPPNQTDGVPAPETVAQLRRELELLRAEREARELALAEMRANRRLQDAERAIAAAPAQDVQLVIVRETERAAARMLLRADDIAARGPNSAGEAAAVYTELLETFPATSSAETARARLGQTSSDMNPGGEI